MSNKHEHRARGHLIEAGKIYPGCWKQLDSFRQGRGKDLPHWPDWCYLPLAASYAVISADEGGERISLLRSGDVGRIGALAAWRPTQGIYRFDETLYQALVDTPITGDLPVEVLMCLPEWCVYIETPGLLIDDDPLAGFFAHLEWDANTQRQELRLLLDITMPDGYLLLPIPIHLTGTLREGIKAASVEAQRQAWRLKRPDMADVLTEIPDLPFEPLVSLVLYLCVEQADFGGEGPAHPQPKRTKKGWRLFPAKNIQQWDVGVRLGAALRRAAHSTQPVDQEGLRNRPRPHVRKAHWHSFWTGPKDDLEQRKIKVKWLPPIPVNLDDIAELASTVRKTD
jgi:hypothetical protein